MALDIKAWQTALAANTSLPYDAFVLRDLVIPNILGDDTEAILYWAGRNLAKQFNLSNPHALTNFCQQMHWGKLQLDHQNKYKEVYTLRGEDINERLRLNPQANFQLETGFIAQTRQLQLDYPCEATYECKDQVVTITCQLDPNDDELDALNFD
ncbi:MAG: YslB family protein [Candidatus Paralactobacillus gallistercoris]|uniref:YslB family protein n=1 Tax=Candidatus Paralactobacillus gallistercoris TaxID=2838724 RepID=A0A948X0I1_9LACO|nr:YslB family protein [Candidatus Paralactobacillus gallistercoris]